MPLPLSQNQALKQRHAQQLETNLHRTETVGNIQFDPLHQNLTEEETLTPLAAAMKRIEEAPFPVQEALAERQETYSERKKQKSYEKQQRKAIQAAQEAQDAESSLTAAQFRQERREKTNAGLDPKLTQEEFRSEKAILNKRLNAIAEQESADLISADLAALKQQQLEKAGGDAVTPENSQEALRLKVRWEAQKSRVDAYHVIATQMPLGSAERTEMMQKKEDAILQAGLLRQQYKVACMPEGKEKKREAATIKRHAKFDALKKIFRKPSLFSHEDAAVTIDDNKILINAGRATLGGTKAMYIFEETLENGGKQEWLFKEATNCIGMSKPEGAVVTGEASKLQQKLRGTLSIPAQCLKDKDGKVLGSIQKRVQKAEGGVDLFKWQAQADLRENAPSSTTLDDLMNEHTLDWILCNFDTKGENFINQENGHIISFDKEASFNSLLKAEAQEMSYTFKPHSNDTIYNTMFAAFARGEITLNLDANLKSIHILENMPADELIDMFKETLDTKYGTEGADRAAAEEALRRRHRDLRKEYSKFYTKLINERIQNITDPEEKEELRALIPNGSYLFADREQLPDNDFE